MSFKQVLALAEIEFIENESLVIRETNRDFGRGRLVVIYTTLAAVGDTHANLF
jgi:hypothetical protein